MKSFYIHRLVLTLGVVSLATGAQAQHAPYGSPSLLPMPQAANRYHTTQTSAYYRQQPTQAVPAQDGSGQPPVPMNNNGQSQPEMLPSQGAGSQAAPDMQDGARMYDQQGGQMYGQGGEIYGQQGGQMYSEYASGGSRGLWGGTYGGGYGGGRGIGSSLSGVGSCLFRGSDYMIGELPGRCGWFGSAAGLIMTRDNDNRFTFSFENTPGGLTDHIQLLDVRDADMDWAGGVEVSFGRYFNCGRNAIEFVYWGLYPGANEFTLTDAQFANPLDGIQNWTSITALDGGGAPQGGDFWVTDAEAHRIRRDFEFHNAEINFLNYSGCAGFGQCGQRRFHHNWGLGARYFRFEEDLLFSARAQGTGTVFNGDANQLDYAVDVANNLIGFQLTGDGEYFLSNRLSLTFGGKIGLFANHINHMSRISSAGNIAFVNNGPLAGHRWDINSNKNDVAMLAELNIGMGYQVSKCWSINAGYRGMAATGVALSSNQIYSDLRGVNDAQIIDSNGSLILHGAFVGAEYNY